MARGDKPYMRKSTDRKAQISPLSWTNAFDSWFVLCDLQIFSCKVYHTEPHHAQSLFLFPIVFGINLIHFFLWEEQQDWAEFDHLCLGFSITRRAIQERVGTMRANFLATESVNFSATMVRQEVWREKRKVRFFGKGKCELTAIVRIFGMGKCKLIANFSATMMASLPSISLSLSVCIIGSAEALPILCVRYFRWEREREIQTERERERDRERRKWRHHCRAKIGDELTLSLAKNSHFSFLPSHFPSLPSRRGHHGGAEIRNEFTLSIAKIFFALRLCSPSFKWHEPRDEGSKTQDKWSNPAQSYFSSHRKNESN